MGGRYGDTEPPVLLVSVQAPAVDGRANDAVVRALAEAFGVPRGSVRILSGSASRTKLVDLDCSEEDILKSLLRR